MTHGTTEALSIWIMTSRLGGEDLLSTTQLRCEVYL